MNNKSSYRIIWIDHLKFFAIFLVVCGHFIMYPGSIYGGMNNWLYQHIYSFHMPLFMSLSGFFSANLLDGKGDVLKKFRQLMIPWILLELIFNIIGYNYCNMWYLVCLFTCYIICFCYLRLFKILRCNMKVQLAIAIVLCFISFPIFSHSSLQFIKIDYMLPFFVFGIIVNKNDFLFKDKCSLIILSCLFVLFEFLWQSNFIWYYSPANWLHKTEPYISFNNLYLSGMRYVTGLIGTLFFLSLFHTIGVKFDNIMNKLPNWGKYSLHIYILQTCIIEIGFNHFGLQFPQGNEILWIWILSPLMSLIVCVICIYMAKVMSMNYYIDKYMFGNVKRNVSHQ